MKHIELFLAVFFVMFFVVTGNNVETRIHHRISPGNGDAAFGTNLYAGDAMRYLVIRKLKNLCISATNVVRPTKRYLFQCSPKNHLHYCTQGELLRSTL